MEDVAKFAKSLKDHLRQAEFLMQLLQETNVTLALEKCFFPSHLTIAAVRLG